MRPLFPIVAAVALMGLPAVVTAQSVIAAPNLLNFQGRLAKPDGTPVADGTYSVTFSLWDAVTNGNKKWERTYSSLQVKNGTFAVLLGSGTAFPAGTFNGDLWLQIKVGTANPLTPRQQLVSVAFAQKANTVPDGSITTAKIADGAITAAKLGAGVGGGATGPAGGDLTGTYPNPSLKNDPSLLFKVSGSLMSAIVSNSAPDQVQNNVNQTGTDFAWQSFSPSQAGKLTGVGFHIGTSNGQPHTADLVLRKGRGPGGVEISRVQITVQPTMGMQSFTLGNQVAIVPTEEYTIEIGSFAPLRFGYSTGNPYPKGVADLGDTMDYAFATYLLKPVNPLVEMFAPLTAHGRLESTTGGVKFPDGSIQLTASNVWASHGADIYNTNTGKVGIGTEFPQQSLSVARGLNLDQNGQNDGSATNALTFGANSGEGIGSKRSAGGNLYGLDFYTGFANRMSITNSGKVGIGRNDPQATLDVNGNIGLGNTNLPMGLTPEVGVLLNLDMNFRSPNKDINQVGAAIRLDARNEPGAPLFQFLVRDAGSTDERIPMSLSGSGKVGIGTNDPGSLLHVKGGVNNVGIFAGDLAPFGTAAFQTNLSQSAAHAWYAENGNRVASVTGGGVGYFKGALSTDAAFNASGYIYSGAYLQTSGNVYAGGFVYGGTYVQSAGDFYGGGSIYGGDGGRLNIGSNTASGGPSKMEVTSGNNNTLQLYNNNGGSFPALYVENRGGGQAGYFKGYLSSSDKRFTIDHPLDPENSYLVHGCVESDERKNIYDGTVKLDANGEAWVELPKWFEALNKDFRYQLTCIGGYAQVYIADEVANGKFRIAGGRTGLKVSWQVTGVRKDAYAAAHPMKVEQDKGVDRGKYIYPELFGQPASKGGAMREPTPGVTLPAIAPPAKPAQQIAKAAPAPKKP